MGLRKLAAQNFERISRRNAKSIVAGKDFTPADNLTMNDVLLQACENDGDKMCASFELHQKQFSFAEINSEAEKIGASLLSLGLQPGDNIAIWGPNQPEWLLTKWAAAKVGMPLVNINPLYTAHELEYALNKVQVKCLICPKEIGPLQYHSTIKQLIPDLDEQDRFSLISKNVSSLKQIVLYSTTADDEAAGYFKFSELYDMADSTYLNQAKNIKVDSNAIGNIQFTSGTTGMPKAAALSHYNLVNNGISVNLHCNRIIDNWNTESIICNVLPLYHVFGFVAGSICGAIMNASSVYPAPGFNADLAIKAIEKRNTTHLIGTPTMFNDIVNSPIRKNHDISSLSYAIVGGSPATPALVRQAESELGCVMSVGYGMTENTCGTFLTALGDVPEITTKTVGHPIPGCEGKIVNPETEEILEEGEIGELCTRGFMVFQGYVGEPEKTAESFTKDGWWKTGDLAVIENGVTRITGRSKDMIIRGGENIQPTEIENYICSMEQVQDCYVIGVPSKRLGEEVAAYVKLTDEASSSSNISVDEVLEYAKTGLARFKVPKYLKFTELFPQTVTGKIKKFELRKQAMTDFPELADEL